MANATHIMIRASNGEVGVAPIASLVLDSDLKNDLLSANSYIGESSRYWYLDRAEFERISAILSGCASVKDNA